MTGPSLFVAIMPRQSAGALKLRHQRCQRHIRAGAEVLRLQLGDEADIVALGSKVCAQAPAAEGLLISCGGLRTLGVAPPLEGRHGIPVVSSTQAAFWAALRLVGESGQVKGRGRLLEQSAAGTMH